MNHREAFTVGFLTRCADRGLNGAETSVRMQKAALLLEKRAFLGQDTLTSALGSGVQGATALGVTLPLLAGAGIGALAHHATTPEVDEEDVKKQELIDEFRHYARRAREKQQARTLRHF